MKYFANAVRLFIKTIRVANILKKSRIISIEQNYERGTILYAKELTRIALLKNFLRRIIKKLIVEVTLKDCEKTICPIAKKHIRKNPPPKDGSLVIRPIIYCDISESFKKGTQYEKGCGRFLNKCPFVNTEARHKAEV